MERLIILAFACMFLLFTSCKKNGEKNAASIGYGTSFGMCAGYCKKEMLIIDQYVSYSKSKHGANPDTKTCSKAISGDEANEIRNLLDENVIKSLPEVIGCPDCADGGAEWIEVTINGKKRKVTFEYGSAPNEIKDLVVKLRTLAASFNNCD